MGLTKEQLILRKSGIGGSDVAAILGLSNYRDIVDVYKDKTSPEVVEKEINERMHWGNVLEAPVAEEYARQTGHKIYTSAEMYKHTNGQDLMLRHPGWDFLIGNVDRFYETPDGRRGILEIKTTSKHYMSGWKYDLPLEYYCQVQHYMYIAKALGLIQIDEAHVAILASGQEFTVVPTALDQKYLDDTIPKLKDFWNGHVMVKIPPEPVDGDQVEKLYTAMSDKEIKATDEVYSLVQELATANEKRKNLEKQEKQLKSQVKLIMKDAEILTHDDDVILTWKQSVSNKLDQKALEADYPDLVNDYKKESSYRKIDVKIKAEAIKED